MSSKPSSCKTKLKEKTMKTRNKIRGITQAAIIAAIYVVLTYITNIFGLANGAVQCRLSEAMCVLPAFTGSAIPGLFVGCLISNLLRTVRMLIRLWICALSL